MSPAPIHPEAKRLSPGVYSLGNEIHVDAVEVLEHLGYEATEENLARVTAAAQKVTAGDRIPLEIREYHE